MNIAPNGVTLADADEILLALTQTCRVCKAEIGQPCYPEAYWRGRANSHIRRVLDAQREARERNTLKP